MKKLILISAAVSMLTLFTPAMCKSPAKAQLPADKPPETVAGYETVPLFSLGVDAGKRVTLYDAGEVKSLSLYEYLVGVLAAEMPPSFPSEALKAQAVAARTYILYTIKQYENGAPVPESHHGAQFCSDHTHCQAYTELTVNCWGADTDALVSKLVEAVKGTDGVVALWQGEPIAAVFCSCAGGRTESSEDVWGGALPYLVSVESPGEEGCEKYLGQTEMTLREFRDKVKKAMPDAVLGDDPGSWFRDSVRSEGGGVISVYLGGVKVKGTFVRELFGLGSTNFTCRREGDKVIFTTIGHGHGVGLSQYGAKYLASQGFSYDKIVKWYYSGVSLGIFSE